MEPPRRPNEAVLLESNEAQVVVRVTSAMLTSFILQTRAQLQTPPTCHAKTIERLLFQLCMELSTSVTANSSRMTMGRSQIVCEVPWSSTRKAGLLTTQG